MDGQAGFGATHEGETPFGFEELFYSRTDKRGMIEAGNAVFQRVSGYEWQKLLVVLILMSDQNSLLQRWGFHWLPIFFLKIRTDYLQGIVCSLDFIEHRPS